MAQDKPDVTAPASSAPAKDKDKDKAAREAKYKAIAEPMQTWGQGQMTSAGQEAARAAVSTYTPSYKRGGKVRKTGVAKLHKGERVVARGKKDRKKARKGGR